MFLLLHFCNQKAENMPSFILNDENVVNSYGFRVANNGLLLERFKANPVLLNSHFNDPAGVVGRWTNIRIEDGKLLADPEFDTEDEAGKKLKGKVDRGFLKGASLGLLFNPEKMTLAPDGNFLLNEAEVMEASIVAVPSNSGAVRLYASTGDLLTEDQVKLSLSGLKDHKFSKHKKSEIKMKKVILSLAVLAALDLQKFNTQEGVEVDALDAAVLKLKADLDQAQTKVKDLEAAAKKMSDQLAAQLQAKVKALIDGAITAGKLSAAEKDSWTELATNNYELAEKTLSAIPGKQSLAGQVNNPAPGAAQVKTQEDFQKLSLEQQLAFRDTRPEEYHQLFPVN